MSTTPTSLSHLDDASLGSGNNIFIGYYTHIPHILMTKFTNANTIIDDMISHYNRYQVGDYREALKDLHSLRDHYNSQEESTNCGRRYPIPHCREHITLLLNLINATDTFNALVKKIFANDLSDVIETRDTRQYLDVINARKALRKFYKKELQGLTRVE